MADISKRIVFEVELNDKGKVKIEGLTKGFVKLDTATKRVTQSIKEQAAAFNSTAKAGTNMIDKTGLAGATVVELGRTISDSNYGIRGMANNLSQLSTLMITLITTTGGLANGIKALWSALAGPLGIIIIFQTVITLFERWDMKAREAARATGALENKVSDLAQSFSDLTFQLTRYNTTAEKVDDVVKVLSARYSLFKKVIDSLGDDVPTERLEILIKMYQDFLFTQSSIQNKEAQLKKLREDFAKTEGATSTQRNRFLSAETKLKGNLFDLELRRADFLEYFNKLIKEGRKADDSSKRKDFVAKQLNFDKEIIKSQERVTKSLVRNKEVQIRAEFDALIELAKTRQSDFADAQQLRVDAISNEEDKAKAQYKINIEIRKSEKALNDYIIQLRNERSRNINQLNLDDLAKATALLEREQGLRAEALLKFEMSMTTNDLNMFEVQRDLENAKTENILKNLGRVRNAAILAGEETVAIDEKIAKTKEDLSYRQREIDVQESQAKLQIANQVADAIVAIAGEQSAVGKAVAVSMATINTYEAVTAALGAKPYGPWNIAQAAATAAMGFVQVRNILNTDIVGSDASSTSASTSASFEAPDFNIVGTSATSQLSQTIADSEKSPLKAYVVTDDINNAQEFDRKVNAQASLG